MKRLFALVCAAVFSMFTGVEFILPKDDEFYFNPETGVGDYFQAEIATEDVNYSSLYGLVHGYNWGGSEVCDTTQKQDSRDVWNTIADTVTYASEWSNSLYEPVGDDRSTVSELGLSVQDGICYTITASGDTNICAPAQGTINTSHYACNYGATMEFLISFSDGSSYVVTIDGAKCWYCCAHKEYPEEGRYTATTSDSLKGKPMRAGDILCIGQEGTTITIVRIQS